MAEGVNQALRVAVIGSTGFIGRHVSAAVRSCAPRSTLLGVSRTDAQPVPLDRQLVITLGDDQPALERFLAEERPDVVINCVGVLSNDARATATNVYATAALMAACFACSARPFFIQVGSSAEYAPTPARARTREDGPVEPVSEYGRSKLRASLAALEAFRAHTLRGVVLRLFNVLGPGMSAATLPGRIAAFIRENEGTDLEVGSLAAYRDFIDVRDAAQAMVQAAVRRAEVCGEIVNIGSGRARLTRDLAEGMVARSPRPIRLHESRTGSARSDGVDWQEADVEKANRLLEWEPCHAWETTLEYLTGAGAR